MLTRPDDCRGCSLDPLAEGFSLPEGTGSLGVLVLGEALGKWERDDGLPFRPGAQAGSVLERAFRRCGLFRAQFRLYNTVQCRPPNDLLEGQHYEAGAISHCRVHRERVIREMQPRVILTLRNVPTRTLTRLA